MPLSSDEKERIHEEEKVRAEAREKVHKEAEAKRMQQGCLGFLIIASIIWASIYFANWNKKGLAENESQPASTSATQMLPEVQTFLAQHPEYGRVVAVTDQPDWAQGKRQTITTSSSAGLKDYLFYTQNGRVKTVYAFTKERERILIWEAP